MRTLHQDGNPVRVFAAGQTIADVKEDAIPARDIIREPSIIVKSRGYIDFTFYDAPFSHKSELWSYTLTDPAIDQKFVYYYLLTKVQELREIARATSVKLPQLGVRDTDTLEIPVPPLEVQREIVRTLNAFTDLETELSAEFDARNRQYSFYRDLLLSPKDDWQQTTLGKVADVFDGPHATPKKTDSGPWYLSISSLKDGRFYLDESAHLGEDEYPAWTSRVVPRVGDTMFSYETRIGQAAYWDLDEPAALGRRMGLLRPNQEIDPRFLTLVYLGPEFQSVIESKKVRGATVDRIPIANMRDWPISIPSLSEQKRIVELLDKLDLLANDPATGLSAELVARRQQHDFYGDRLLTFEEATV